MPRNPSAALAQAIAGSPRWRALGVSASCATITTAYRALSSELAPALDAAPDAVLMIGVAGRSRRVRVERRATPRRSTLFPDISGRTADLRGRSPADRLTTVAVAPVLRTIRAGGVPARLSRDAGRYLCNAAYFQALAYKRPTLFIHIPKPASRGRAEGDRRLASALVTVGLGLLRQARVARLVRSA